MPGLELAGTDDITNKASQKLSPSKKVLFHLLQRKSFKNHKKCLFVLKRSSFRSQVV